MSIYQIADLKVKLTAGKHTMQNAEPYLLTNCDSNYDFEIKQNTTAAIADLYEKWNKLYDAADFVYEARQFHTKILDYNGMMLHASAVVVDGEAYLFSAPSGTGKSTHTNLWLELFGDRAYILNDDKPVIRILDDGVFVYGTPWCGKDDIGQNKKARLKAICFLERSDTDWIKKMTLTNSMQIITNMFYETFRQLDRYDCMKPISKENASKYLDMIYKLICIVPIYQLGCTKSINAAKIAFAEMSKE